ncbi:MAG TPA: glycosyl transferase family 28 [Pedococcus sp.]
MTRVAIYAQDATGLGHVTRSLAVARAVRRLHPAPEVLVVTGTPQAASLARPEGCDVLGLPSHVRPGQERYAARDLLGRPAPARRELRSRVLTVALAAFAPDLLVVDRHPRGVAGELEPALSALRGRTTVVLGLRDVVDDPVVARHEWVRTHSGEALSEWFDAVWVFGDRAVHDPTRVLDLPPLPSGTHFTGYLATHAAHAAPDLRASGCRVLGLVGGGSDGLGLALAFLGAAALHGRPGDLVVGPQMPPEDRAVVREAARRVRGVRVHTTVRDVGALVDRAAAVVSMAGYGTVCDVLGRQRPVLVVPRTHPRREQLVRAERLQALGEVAMLHPDDLAPGPVAAWVEDVLGAAAPTSFGTVSTAEPAPRATGVDLGGLARVADLAGATLAGRGAPLMAG